MVQNAPSGDAPAVLVDDFRSAVMNANLDAVREFLDKGVVWGCTARWYAVMQSRGYFYLLYQRMIWWNPPYFQDVIEQF